MLFAKAHRALHVPTPCFASRRKIPCPLRQKPGVFQRLRAIFSQDVLEIDHRMDHSSSVPQNVKKKSPWEQLRERVSHQCVMRGLVDPSLSRTSAAHQGVQSNTELTEEFAARNVVER